MSPVGFAPSVADQPSPEDLVLKQGDLFVKLHERGLEHSEAEARAVASLLKKHGVPDGGTVLDAPCGVGRHAVHLARMGYRVTGLDPSALYVERANHIRERLGLQQGLDFRVGDPRAIGEALRGRTFDAAICMWQSLGYWGEDEDASVLRQMRDLTAAKGVLVVDVLNRDHLVKHLTPFGITRYEDGTEQHEHRHPNLETSQLELLWEFYRREGDDLKHRTTAKVRFRVYALHELLALLRGAGWEAVEAFGSFALDPVSIEKRRLLTVATKA